MVTNYSITIIRIAASAKQKGKVLDEEFFNTLYDLNILQEIELQDRGYNDTKTMIEVKGQELQKKTRALEII